MTDRVISSSIDIDAPADTIFAILADPQQHPRIDGSGSLMKTIKGPSRLSKGASFGMDMKMFGVPYKIRNTVVEFEDGSRIAWRHFGGHRWRYELAPKEDGSTTVTESFDYSMYNIAKARGIEVAKFPQKNRHGIVETLKKLKLAAEDDSSRRTRGQDV